MYVCIYTYICTVYASRLIAVHQFIAVNYNYLQNSHLNRNQLKSSGTKGFQLLFGSKSEFGSKCPFDSSFDFSLSTKMLLNIESICMRKDHSVWPDICFVNNHCCVLFSFAPKPFCVFPSHSDQSRGNRTQREYVNGSKSAALPQSLVFACSYYLILSDVIERYIKLNIQHRKGPGWMQRHYKSI